jgi:transposase
MAKQGCVLTEDETRKIVTLLATTEMSIGEIATRMKCSRSTVAAVNRRYRVRDYAGLRSRWTYHAERIS